ncbi:MAG: helix-hairpin-helix domain-containing protein [Flavobacteriales bacterium]|nr:helix-hairpin-helix domain-containing protein [Flavobacteriales bacterium]
MKFNKKQRVGLFVLIAMIGLLQYIIVAVDFSRFYPFGDRLEQIQLVNYYNFKIDSLNIIENNKKTTKKYFKFNPNKLSYKSWYYLGLNKHELYLLDSFRVSNSFSSSLQVKNVLKLTDSLFRTLDTLMYFPRDYKNVEKFETKKQIRYYRFNPNKFTEKQWLEFGFSPKQSEIICTYRDRIGGFKVKSDIERVFVIDSIKYIELYPYIDIPLEVEVEELNLNSATTADFIKVQGVGGVYSKLIVEYREKLGGYNSFYQLNEINGLDSSAIQIIRRTFVLNEKYDIVKLNINSASFEELKSHPYINYRLAKELVGFRTNFRVFKTVEEIRNIEDMSDAYFNKIKLYLSVDKK